MAELKTRPTDASVAEFLAVIEDPKRRADSETLVTLMREATGAEPVLWGPSIIGFGNYDYRYPDGRTLDWFQIGFSPRKQNLSLYLMGGLDRHAVLLSQLGKTKRSQSCLYINRLSDIDMPTLRALLAQAVAQLQAK